MRRIGDGRAGAVGATRYQERDSNSCGERSRATAAWIEGLRGHPPALFIAHPGASQIVESPPLKIPADGDYTFVLPEGGDLTVRVPEISGAPGLCVRVHHDQLDIDSCRAGAEIRRDGDVLVVRFPNLAPGHWEIIVYVVNKPNELTHAAADLIDAQSQVVTVAKPDYDIPTQHDLLPILGGGFGAGNRGGFERIGEFGLEIFGDQIYRSRWSLDVVAELSSGPGNFTGRVDLIHYFERNGSSYSLALGGGLTTGSIGPAVTYLQVGTLRRVVVVDLEWCPQTGFWGANLKFDLLRLFVAAASGGVSRAKCRLLRRSNPRKEYDGAMACTPLGSQSHPQRRRRAVQETETT